MRTRSIFACSIALAAIAQLLGIGEARAATSKDSWNIYVEVNQADFEGTGCTDTATLLDEATSYTASKDCPPGATGPVTSHADVTFAETWDGDDLQLVDVIGNADAAMTTTTDDEVGFANAKSQYEIDFTLSNETAVTIEGPLTEATEGIAETCAYVELILLPPQNAPPQIIFSQEGPGGPRVPTVNDRCSAGEGGSSVDFEGSLQPGRYLFTEFAEGHVEDTEAHTGDSSANASFDVDLTLAGECTQIGTDGADVLDGTEGDDVICGLGGDDTLDGFGGNDVIIGGPGDDHLFGGPDQDVVEGGEGVDELFGGDADDTLLGGEGTDRARGGPGDDLILGEEGDDITPDGQNQNDWGLRGDTGIDTILGGSGTDLIDGGNDPDQLHGGDGEDILLGGGGEDNMLGGAERDFLHGDTEDDILLGGTGNDFLSGEAGGDLILGEAGDDQLHGDFFPEDVGRDRLEGGRGFDTMLGGPERDCLIGGPQKDVMKGEDGRDTFLARDGRRDTVKGGSGNDRGRFDGVDSVNSVANRSYSGGCN